MLLIIGATGELGSRIVREARDTGVPVRVLARPRSDVEDLRASGVEVWRGDLTDPETLDGLCDGVSTVVATANTIIPRRGEKTSATSLNAGYQRLAEEAERAGSQRFVLVSVPRELMGLGAAEFDAKLRVEEYLRGRQFELCVVRPSLFMESWLPAVGSRLAVTGKHRATLDRGFWLSRFAGAVLHRTADRFGVAQHPGLREVRHSFVSVDDVAKVVFRLAGSTQRLPEEFQVGGQPRTWAEVIDEHSAALGRPLRTLRVPAGPFRAVAALLRPFSPTAANLLRVQGLVGTRSTIVDPSAAEALLGRRLLPVSGHLAQAVSGARNPGHRRPVS